MTASRLHGPGPPSINCQSDTVEHFGQVEEIGDAIGEIERLPRVYPLDGVECEGAETDHEEAERRERGQQADDERASSV